MCSTNLGLISNQFIHLSTVPYAKTARILIAMSVPGNILFIFVADYINMNATTVTWVFMLSYLIASLIQVSCNPA